MQTAVGLVFISLAVFFGMFSLGAGSGALLCITLCVFLAVIAGTLL